MKVLSKRDDLEKYGFQNEYKLKSKNPEKVFNSCKKITIDEETTRSFEKILSFQEKLQFNISTIGRNTVLCFQPYSRCLLINYGILIHGYPGATAGIKKNIFAIPRPHIIFYNRIRV